MGCSSMTKRYDFDATDKVHSHSWITKNVIKKATCTAAGSKVENCASCDAVQNCVNPCKRPYCNERCSQ